MSEETTKTILLKGEGIDFINLMYEAKFLDALQELPSFLAAKYETIIRNVDYKHDDIQFKFYHKQHKTSELPIAPEHLINSLLKMDLSAYWTSELTKNYHQIIDISAK